MKVIILAGGFGTRLAEHTETVPKPMVTIGGRPIIWHIMNHYARYGFKEFVVALGYKASVIREYFYNYHHLNLDFTVDLSNGDKEFHGLGDINWKVTLVDTGINTMTGGRLKRLADLVDNNTFLLTYGDGLSNVDIHELANHHKKHNSLVTLTAVRPAARFGELIINGA
jgi:glucose-1-phosphate cytidylyltransferase